MALTANPSSTGGTASPEQKVAESAATNSAVQSKSLPREKDYTGMLIATPDKTKPKTARTTSKKRRVEHLFPVGSLRFSQEFGIDCRAFCGRWVPVWRKKDFNTTIPCGRIEVDDCRNCVRIVRSKQRNRK